MRSRVSDWARCGHDGDGEVGPAERLRSGDGRKDRAFHGGGGDTISETSCATQVRGRLIIRWVSLLT